MPTGYIAQLMNANFERLIIGANEAGQQAETRLRQAKGK